MRNNCTSNWKMEGEARSSSRKQMCLGVPVCLWGKRHFPIELLFSRVKNSKRHLQGDHSGVGIFCLVSFPPFLNGLRVSWDCRTARRALPDQLRSPAADQLR